jgi:hypothetical protein
VTLSITTPPQSAIESDSAAKNPGERGESAVGVADDI